MCMDLNIAGENIFVAQLYKPENTSVESRRCQMAITQPHYTVIGEKARKIAMQRGLVRPQQEF